MTIQEADFKLQGDAFKETKAYNSQALSNQIRQLQLQSTGITQAATNATNAYNLADKNARESIGDIHINSSQRRTFDEAQRQAGNHERAKLSWNTQIGGKYERLSAVEYDNDGWALVPKYDGGDRLLTLQERRDIKNTTKVQYDARPDFIALEKKFQQELRQLPPLPTQKPRSTRPNGSHSASPGSAATANASLTTPNRLKADIKPVQGQQRTVGRTDAAALARYEQNLLTVLREPIQPDSCRVLPVYPLPKLVPAK